MYDRWADSLDRSVRAPWLDRRVRNFAEKIPEGSAILDVGCGTGRTLQIMTARHPSLLAGIDISPVAFAAAMEKLAPLGADLHFLSRRGLRRLLARAGFCTIAQRRAAFLARHTVAEKDEGTPDSVKPAS